MTVIFKTTIWLYDGMVNEQQRFKSKKYLDSKMPICLNEYSKQLSK